jgi:hypothetical protein
MRRRKLIAVVGLAVRAPGGLGHDRGGRAGGNGVSPPRNASPALLPSQGRGPWLTDSAFAKGRV